MVSGQKGFAARVGQLGLHPVSSRCLAYRVDGGAVPVFHNRNL